MKTIFTVLFAIAHAISCYGQTNHDLLASDFLFSPDTLYIQPGDTVNVTISGYHSATEIDSIDWVNNTDNHNGGFDIGFGSNSTIDWFVLNNIGTHYYICEPHAAMGMKGVIIVDNAQNIQNHFDPNNFSISQSSDGQINLSYSDANQIDIFDMTGKLVYTGSLELSSGNQNIACNLSKGAYIFRFSKDNNLRVSKKALLSK
jgi:plastocyanin